MTYQDPIILWYNIQIEQTKQDISKYKRYPPTIYSKNTINRLRREIRELEIQKKKYRLSKMQL